MYFSYKYFNGGFTMKLFFSKHFKSPRQRLLFLFVLVSILLLVSSCHFFTTTNSNKQLTSITDEAYLFYELYDHSGELFETIVASNASDAAKSVTLEKLLNAFSQESYPSKDATDKLHEDNDVFTLNMNAFSSEKKYDNYSVAIDFNTQRFQITADKDMLIYSDESFDELIQSGILEYFFPKRKLPQITLSHNLEELDTQLNGTWNYYIYQSYYSHEIISDDFIATPDYSAYVIETEPQTIELSIVESDQTLDIPSATYALYDASQNLIEQKALLFENKKASIILPNTNGNYHLAIDYNWPKTSQMDYGTLTQNTSFSIELPTTYTLNHSTYEPGDLVVVKADHVSSDAVYTFESDIYHEELTWIKQDDANYLFLPLTSKLSSGAYVLKIHEERAGNTVKTTQLPIEVIDKDFPTQQLKTSSTTASIRSNENEIALAEAFKRARELNHDQPLWTGAFLQPVGGRISTEYGVIRYTNDAVESSRHNGIDFANPTGTPILATESGYVRMSEHLAITGNTIFIDHGVGIYSQYYHLETLDVGVGDYVEKGDVIGTVGSTGFSTGPHLHFSMYNNGVYVNPWKFFEAAPF